MSDFQVVEGFEDVWRPPTRPLRRSPKSILGGKSASAGGIRERLARVVHRAPEVMVKVTGRTREAGHLAAHLEYISRNGQLDLEDQDGCLIIGRREVAELAGDWAIEALTEARRANQPFTHSVVLSMPEGSDPLIVRDAARAFARDIFADRHDYVFALHTDTPSPHVHLTVRSGGRQGQRLNPKKADLECWRQTFAEALRARGCEAEATPRRARGICLKAERQGLRHMSTRHAHGKGPTPRVQKASLAAAAKRAVEASPERRPWEARLVTRQAANQALYARQAELLARGVDPADRALAAAIRAFLSAMPSPDTRQLSLARDLRRMAGRAGRDRDKGHRDR